TRVGASAVVTLQRMSIDTRSMGDGVLAGIDLEALEVAWTLPLRGLKNCGPVVVAPDATLGAVACTGYIDRSGAATNLDESAIVTPDLTQTPPAELGRLAAAELAGAPLQAGLEFFAPRRVLAKTQTALDGASNNRILAVDLDASDAAEAAETLVEARPN